MTATDVKERPIIMTAHSVQQILAGVKTQTRRVLKPQPGEGWRHTGELIEIHNMAKENPLDHVMGMGFCNADGDEGYACPHGAPGERLWVKESWHPKSNAGYLNEDDGSITVIYSADGARAYFDDCGGVMPDDWTLPAATKKGRPLTPLFMPRWASRLMLEVTGLRVERLVEISPADVIAEGVECLPEEGTLSWATNCRDRFAMTWNAINGRRKGCAWRDNPWVWIVEFRRLEGKA